MFTPKIHEDWEIKTYCGIKSYAPPNNTVPNEVVPGVYEGGFQLWECTLDLLKFMETIDFNGKTVYELGCGRGLPGIYAALHGASQVVLQDFNKEVVEELCIPNAQINNCPENIVSYSADSWADIPKNCPSQSYDVILASETIYRKEQLPVFVDAFSHLVKPDGIVVVAAKRMYFGLSGSVYDLIELVKGKFTYKLTEFKDKSAYTRDVIVLQKIQ
ncbi:hypothetical protein TRFO_23542 [Tritrichomonas foetus]|uniref:protein-histidine N-methyltransferase n=1 Tax=Tritrichomonas foetus TaxID=1144522 RepID=A0A1J4K9D8_9EUKA|nr:hypothetical protein TRFO_23542 [Tritrichomonas foetus]|eukprot:OHT08089.1 hypothetical protein TRFO_23542 [Tritrichomonas foetus]